MPTILIAEDSVDTREHLTSLLEKEGYRVVPTANGREALSYLQAEMEHGRPLPALLITDLNMPNMDGMQLIAELARTKALAVLPIIEVSGTSPASLHMVGLSAPMRRGLAGGQSDGRPGRAGGVVGSFVKPIQGQKEKEFLALVAQHAGKGAVVPQSVSSPRTPDEMSSRPSRPSAVRTISQLTPEQRAGLRDFFQLYVAHFDQLNKDLIAQLLPHPQWGPIITGMSPAVRDEQNRLSLDFMRTALVDGDWEPLLGNMRDQGAQYAEMGFSFASWYEIIGPLRHYLVPIMVRELVSDPARLARALQAMSLYLDVAMSIIGDQYIDSKEELIHNQKFYTRSLVEANGDALTATDRFGIVTDVNKAMEVLAGRTRDELIGSPFSSHFTDPARAAALINQAASTGKVTDYDLTVRSKDGKTTVVAYNATTFHSRDRTLVGVFAAARDLTRYSRR